MANFQWVPDIPSGVQRNHALSSKLREAAIEMTKVVPFTRPEPGYGKGQGDTHNITRISNIAEPSSISLDENELIPEDTHAVTNRPITVSEIGRSLPYTNLAETLTHFDLRQSMQVALRKQLGLGLDTLAATAFKGAQISYTPTGETTGGFETGGTVTSTATANLNVFHIEEIRDYLIDTLHCPTFDDENYVGIFRLLGLRGVKRDPDWEEWHKYTDPGAKFRGEAGKIESVRLIETNHANAFAKVGTGSVLGEGVIFGEDPVVLVEATKPELLVGIPGDLGRRKIIGWYGILAFGEVWNTNNAGQARIVHVDSA